MVFLYEILHLLTDGSKRICTHICNGLVGHATLYGYLFKTFLRKVLAKVTSLHILHDIVSQRVVWRQGVAVVKFYNMEAHLCLHRCTYLPRLHGQHSILKLLKEAALYQLSHATASLRSSLILTALLGKSLEVSACLQYTIY